MDKQFPDQVKLQYWFQHDQAHLKNLKMSKILYDYNEDFWDFELSNDYQAEIIPKSEDFEPDEYKIPDKALLSKVVVVFTDYYIVGMTFIDLQGKVVC